MKNIPIVAFALLAVLKVSAQTNFYVNGMLGDDANASASLGTALKKI